MRTYIHEYFRRVRLLTWNDREQRPRSFLRVWLFLTFYTGLYVSIPHLFASSENGLFRSATLRVLLVCGTGILLLVSAKYLDKRPVDSFGFQIDRRWIADGFVGFIVGGMLPAVAVALGYLGGWITIDEIAYVSAVTYARDLGLALVITVSIAVVEESVFRGYVLTNAIEGLNLRELSQTWTVAIALCLSALLFVGVHVSPTLVSGLHFLSAGFLLGIAYLLSGQLGLPVGIHAGFNFVSAYVFPTGADPSVAVISFTISGSAWLAGQTGLVRTGLLLPAILAMMGYFRWLTGDLCVNSRIKSETKNW